MFEYPLLLILPMAMAYAAVSDLLTLTIPNRISLALVAGFVAVAPTAGLSWSLIGHHLAAGGIVLAFGIALFAFRIFGGGDAKLLAAGSLWLGLEHLPQFLGYLAIYGGILSVVILLYRRLIPAAALPLPDWAQRLHQPRGGVPYGVAIAAAALVVYPKTPLFVGLVS